MKHFPVSAGKPWPLGATVVDGGVNFAVFSQHATRMTLCLFDDRGREHLNLDLPEREGHIWHGHVSGIGVGQHYGYRAHGPYRPDEGHRFNPHKLLLDPYAKAISGPPIWDASLYGYDISSKHGDLTFDTRNSGNSAPRGIVEDPVRDWEHREGPRIPMTDTLFYEAHVKGMTALRRDGPPPGTFLAMSAPEMIDHIVKLGVTSVELMPVQAFLDEDHLLRRGLRNYWGYMSYGFFAPDPRYLAGGQIAEFQQMVARYHAAGLEVILDVVYNHTAEGNHLGPTLSFRGLDNASYYRLAETPRYYIDDTGCGNTLNVEHPMVARMVLDSLRYWVEVMGVDGFRFDLASTLGRRSHGFDREAPFLTALRQDPILGRVKLIAEPWDTGPGGYQLGSFPWPFSEWNDKYRDQMRRFWRGDAGHIRKLAIRVAGSALRFDHDGRPATSSVNFITAHDGFTLSDLVSYNQKHNEANGEQNRDGHAHNFSDNCGAEGPTKDKAILDKRAQRRRNLMATLLLSQGTPLILAGDEIGNSQGGNNNAYCQDNAIGWIDWDDPDLDFLAFCRRAIAFRKAHPILRQSRFLHSRSRLIDGAPDLFWRRADGRSLTNEDWTDPALRHLVVELRTAEGTPEYTSREGAILIVFNTGGAFEQTLPEAPNGYAWVRRFDTGPDQSMLDRYEHSTATINQDTVVAFDLSDLTEEMQDGK